jgi:hypothetical protein
VEGEDVVSGAVAGAEASLVGRTGATRLCPSGQAGLQEHGVGFGEGGADREATVVGWVHGVALAFEDGVNELAVEGGGEGAGEEGGEDSSQGRGKGVRCISDKFRAHAINTGCFVAAEPLKGG